MLKWSCFYGVTKSWTELPLFLKIWIPLCIKQWFNILLNVKRGSLAEWAVRPQVQVRTWLLAGFVPSSPELKSLTTLVNEQLVQSCALAEPDVACEYSCFSLFLTAKDVLPREMSATQWQKFHTDGVKSVLNLVRSSDWSM